MNNKEALSKLLEGKPDDEKRALLRENYKTYYDKFEGYRIASNGNQGESCGFFGAQVFEYCTANDLQEELDFFFFLVNLFAGIFGFCFTHEDTVYLGCTCPCWRNQVILYFSIAFNDD